MNNLQVYKIPAGTPSRVGIFTVTVNGQPLGLLTERNAWEKPCSMGVFDMDLGTEVEVKIWVDKPFESARLFPEEENIPLTREGDCLVYHVNRPVNALSLVLDNDYQAEALHIFSNPIDHQAPTESTKDVIYVSPGYHNLSAYGAQKPDLSQTEKGTLTLRDNQTLYVAGGAVIDGTVYIGDAKNVTVKGSGILMKGEDCAVQTPEAQGICLVTARASQVSVEGVVCHSHRWHNWTVHFWHSSDIQVSRLKVFSPVYASTDGIDISNSQRITVKDSFIRACDDCVAIKGLAGEHEKPADCPPIEDILFEHCVLWNDCNNCMGIGAETRASHFTRITFRDIRVIYSWDDRDWHEKLDERSVMTICSLHGTTFSDILWENIRITACQRVMCLCFKDSFWFGTLPGDQSTPGGMERITFRDITVEENTGSAIAGECLLYTVPGKAIDQVRVENVHLYGQKVTDATWLQAGPGVTAELI